MGVDCEYTIDRRRVWIRVAVATADQGSAFGRGGRNIQAIRTVVQAAAATVGQSIHLDVYGNNSSFRTDTDDGQDNGGGASGSRPARTAPNRRSAGGEEASAEEVRQRSNVPPPKPRRQA
jgi:uncharacterized protein